MKSSVTHKMIGASRQPARTNQHVKTFLCGYEIKNSIVLKFFDTFDGTAKHSTSLFCFNVSSCENLMEFVLHFFTGKQC